MEEANNNNQNSKNYSGCLSFLLPLWIFGQIIHIVYNLVIATGGLNTSFVPYILVAMNILTIIAIIFLLKYNKIGFYLFCFCLTVSIVIGFGWPEELEPNSGIKAFFAFLLFIGLLFTKDKETGLNAYQVLGLFHSNSYNKTNEKKGQEPVPGDNTESIIKNKEECKSESTIVENKEDKDIMFDNGVNQTSVIKPNSEKICNIYTQSDNSNFDSISNKDEIVTNFESNVNIKKTNYKLLVGIFAVLILVILGFVFSYQYNHRLSPNEKFAIADSLIKNNKYSEGMALLEEIKEEYTPAKALLGDLLVLNDSVEKNIDLGMKYLLEASSLNDTSACISLFRYYADTNVDSIYYYAKKANDLGCKRGTRALAIISYKKQLLGRYNSYYNLKMAEYYALKIADSDSYSCFILGDLYYGDNNVFEVDYNKSFYWFKKGAELEDSDCYDNLGWHYINGNGVKQNFHKAMNCFKKAIELNNKDEYAYFQIAQLYHNEQGVQYNIDSVKYYLSKAADNGNIEATVLLENEDY